MLEWAYKVPEDRMKTDQIAQDVSNEEDPGNSYSFLQLYLKEKTCTVIRTAHWPCVELRRIGLRVMIDIKGPLS